MSIGEDRCLGRFFCAGLIGEEDVWVFWAALGLGIGARIFWGEGRRFEHGFSLIVTDCYFGGGSAVVEIGCVDW